MSQDGYEMNDGNEQDPDPGGSGTNNEEQGASSADKHEHDLDSSGEGEVFRKRQRQYSPSPSPRPSYSPTASPHKHSTFEELLATAGLLENMTLAHEIVVDGNFKFTPKELPKDSFQRRVHETMHQAFWDVLKSDLEEDPPTFDRAITLLEEVKSLITSFLLPRNERYRSEIEEVLDLDLIQQQAEHGALDVRHYAQFILVTMAKLCAPIRDDDIQKLHEIDGIVDLYREIFRVLDLMKLDMANFTIQTVRPHLQQHSVEYERNKFQEFLKVQQDGLEYTKRWLEDVNKELREFSPPVQSSSGASSTEDAASAPEGAASAPEGAASVPEGAASAPEGATPAPSISPLLLLNHAYIKLLHWDPQKPHTFPETVLMDQGRLDELGNQVKKACLIASVLLVTYTHVGPAISGIQGLPSKLKFAISVILADSSDTKSVMPNIAEQVCEEIKMCLSEHGYKEMDASRMEALRAQLCELGDESHTIRKLLNKRAKAFFLTALSSPHRTDLSTKIPPGLSTIQRQMVQLAVMFTKVAFHNRSVYGPFYSEIIASLLELQR